MCIDDLMKKYGLSELGIDLTMNVAWGSYARRESLGIAIYPCGVGVFSGRTVDEAVAKVAQFQCAVAEGGI